MDVTISQDQTEYASLKRCVLPQDFKVKRVDIANVLWESNDDKQWCVIDVIYLQAHPMETDCHPTLKWLNIREITLDDMVDDTVDNDMVIFHVYHSN